MPNFILGRFIPLGCITQIEPWEELTAINTMATHCNKPGQLRCQRISSLNNQATTF